MADSPRIEDLRRRVQKDPASIAFAQLAEELRRAGIYDEAIATCHAGLALHPGYLSARVTLGRALLETNALDDAQRELETVLKSAPENLAAIRGMAEIFHRQGRLPDALTQYRAALALAKNDPDLQQTVAELAALVEPPKPAHHADGLSFEQMRNELFAIGPPAAKSHSPSQEAPGTLGNPPSTFENAPSTFGDAPSTLEDPPSTFENAPSTFGDTPSTLENSPSTFDDAPSTLENPPSTFENAPSTLENPPSTFDDAPSTLENPPSTLQSAPGTVQSPAQVEHERALRTIVALEQMLDAIHVARTHPRA